MKYDPRFLIIGHYGMLSGIYGNRMQIDRNGNLLTITTNTNKHWGVLFHLLNYKKEFLFDIREPWKGNSRTVCKGRLKGHSIDKRGAFIFEVLSYEKIYFKS